MTAELFTVATRPMPGLARLRESLSIFQVPLTVLGQKELEYRGHAWRWKTFIKAVKTSSAATVIHCDGYDSVCLGSLGEMLSKFASLAHPIVFSCEAQEEPGFSPALNPGLMVACRDTLLNVFNDQILEEFFPDHFNDQHQIRSMYGWKPDTFMLDREGIIFYTLGPHAPDLIVRKNRLTHPLTGACPCFVHAPNCWDLSKIDKWLAGFNEANPI